MSLSKLSESSLRLLNALESKKIILAKDLDSLGIDRRAPSALEKEGHIYSLARGIYIRSDEISPWTNYWALAAHTQEAVFCLYSALVIHGVTTQHAHSVWCEMPRGVRKPSMPNIDVEYITATPWIHNLGVKTVRLDQIPVRVTTLERTVVDCFRLRRVVGMEVALEALKEVIGGSLVKVEDLENMAKKLRMYNVMKPYIEAII
ncbi:hypothetical protein ACI2KR_08485 [Pseudomonas luteola]